MHNSFVVEVEQSLNNLEDNAADSLFVGLEMFDEADAVNVLEQHKYVVFVGEAGVLLNDVWVIQTVQNRQFFNEMLLHLVLSHGRLEDLFDSVERACVYMPALTDQYLHWQTSPNFPLPTVLPS